MRILQVADSFTPAVGGIERYVEALGRRLAATGHDVAVVTSALRGDAAVGHPAVDQVGDVEVFRVPSAVGALQGGDGTLSYLPTFRDPVFARRLAAVLDRWRPDVVHAHGWAVHSTLGPARHARVPLVVSLHEYGLVCPKKTLTTADGALCADGPAARRCIPCGGDQYGGVLRSAAVALPLTLARPQRWPVARFVANSGHVADAVARFSGVPRPAIDVVPPSTLPTSALAPEDAPGTGVLPGLPGGPFLLYVGALSRHKGLHVLLDAHRRMRIRWPLVVLGASRAEPLPGLDAPDVVVRTDVPHEQVLDAWRRAAVGVVPSTWAEPFGQVAVECLAAGTPLVVSDVGGLAELVDPERTGLRVPAGDAAALAQALDRLADDDGLRARLGAAGRAACGALTVEATTDRMVEVYERARASAEVAA